MSAPILNLPSIEAHALWAATYDKNPNPLLPLEERTVLPFLPSMDGLVAVDVACGTGRWLEHLVRRGAKTAVGLDLSSAMLRKAFLKPTLSDRLVEADCLTMPLRSSSADFVISSFCLGYIEDLGGLARELSRVVRHGGHLIVSDFHPSAHERGWKRSFRHDEAVIEISSFHRPLDRICESFTAEGFDLIRCVAPRFGSDDQPLFDRCRKRDLFLKVVGEEAIFVCLFRRMP